MSATTPELLRVTVPAWLAALLVPLVVIAAVVIAPLAKSATFPPVPPVVDIAAVLIEGGLVAPPPSDPIAKALPSPAELPCSVRAPVEIEPVVEILMVP